MKTFEELGLIPELLNTIQERGYDQPTPIQELAIPLLLDGKDVIGQSKTGTGKTAAFVLPILQQLEAEGLQMLVLTPTRELAVQVATAVYEYGKRLNIQVQPIYGGQPYARQIRRLQKGVHVVVGTPGRTLDLIRQRALDLSNIRHLVIDEADEMLKMGFIEDVEAILGETNVDARQTALFSATFPNVILRLAQKYMHDPVTVEIESNEKTVENIAQSYFLVRESDKVVALSRLLESEDLDNTLIFTRTKDGAATLAETLIARHYPASAIHGDLPQEERERILNRFRKGQLTILVATDVVARGVDIPQVSHVINYDIPQLPIEYVHRIGRTGRAGRDGNAITLITPAQYFQLRRIEEYTNRKINEGTMPSRDAILQRREEQFKQEVVGWLDSSDDMQENQVLNDLMASGYSAEQIATTLIQQIRDYESQRPLEEIQQVKPSRDNREHRPRRKERRARGNEPGMVSLFMNVGRSKGIRPGDIVYTIASEANIKGRTIGAIDIRQHETYVDVPEADVDKVLKAMKHTKIRGTSIKMLRAHNGFNKDHSKPHSRARN